MVKLMLLLSWLVVLEGPFLVMRPASLLVLLIFAGLIVLMLFLSFLSLMKVWIIKKRRVTIEVFK